MCLNEAALLDCQPRLLVVLLPSVDCSLALPLLLVLMLVLVQFALPPLPRRQRQRMWCVV